MSLSIPIIFEHQDFIIAYKHEGISFHQDIDCPHSQGFFYTLEQQTQQKLYPVHRLDKVTSGLIIAARSVTATQEFQQHFQQRQIHKQYLALAKGKPHKKQGWIKGDMQVSRRGQWKLMRSLNNPAITQFESLSLGDGLRLYSLYPKTGKTHQLRVAMKSLGTPILGDILYGNKLHMQQYDRTYLHAYRLHFNWSGQAIDVWQRPLSGQLFKDDDLDLLT